MISVFIVDDHYMVIEGIRSLLQDEPGIEFSGYAADAASCRTYLKINRPDILLLDISLPDENGIDFCKELYDAYPSMAILALTTFNQETMIRNMLDNGASGYLLKNAGRDEIKRALQTVYRGQQYLSFDVAQTLRKSSLQTNEMPVLTRREKEVLELIAEGCNTKEIADKLFIGTTTVDTYRKNLLIKLNARNTAMLIKLALQHRLISFDV
ncbi:MAG: response regulator transcription factor [Chitinophagaceae bacterium]|nr:MAG: response regulator transcription factor [Chitinophagaceae bacterium]